ncbi:hypothetical protein Ae201684P_014908 [Aphanomyces euteiches]|nr:hypothetical protein Ae201684P_014908 [Aphanomyces euteiches]
MIRHWRFLNKFDLPVKPIKMVPEMKQIPLKGNMSALVQKPLASKCPRRSCQVYTKNPFTYSLSACDRPVSEYAPAFLAKCRRVHPRRPPPKPIIWTNRH